MASWSCLDYSRLRSTTKQVGFTEAGVSWEGTHPRGGRISLNLCVKTLKKLFKSLQHVLRAGWRHQMVLEWQNADRRDAVQCRDVPYSLDNARKLPMTSHTLACLSGGLVSPHTKSCRKQAKSVPIVIVTWLLFDMLSGIVMQILIVLKLHHVIFYRKG